MKNLVLGFFAVLLFSSAVLAQSYFRDGKPITEAQYKASNLNTEAMNLMRANENEKAIAVLKEALSLDPGLSQAHHNLGLAFSKIGHAQEAIDELRKAVELNPQSAMSLLTLGGAYQTCGRLEEALETYKEILKRFADFPDKAEVKGLVSNLKDELARQKSAGNLSDNDSYFRQVTGDNPSRWCSGAIPVRIFIADGQGVLNFRPEFVDLVKNCFVDWVNILQGRVLIQFVNDPHVADIAVVWTANPKELPNPAECGFADFTYKDHCFIKGTIKLLTLLPNHVEPISTIHLRKACLHEVGHILGLKGHSPDPNDAMFYSLPSNDKWMMPSKRDAETIVRLYSEPNLESLTRISK